MKRFASAALSLLMASSLATVTAVAGPSGAASAAPPGPTTLYSATGTGQILGLDATAIGLNLADVGVATTNATTSSTSTPRSSATSSNIAAAVVGLPVTVSKQTQIAPPDNTGPITGGLPSIGVNLLLLQLQANAIQTSNLARWAGDTSCVADPGVLADSNTATGDASLTLAGTNLLTLAAADVRNTNALVNTAGNVGANKAIRSTAVGTVTDLKLLNNTVTVTVTGNPTLTATATGKTGGSTVTSNASSVVVSVKIGAAAPVVVPLGGSIPILGLGTLRVNTPVVGALAANGTSAVGSWDFLTLGVNLGLARATVNLLSLTSEAKAPVGGLDCPAAVLEAPVIVVPAEGATTGTTPTISGTARPNASVVVTLDTGATVTTTASASGAWSVVSPVLAAGPHTATAVQTVAAETSPSSPVRNFNVVTDIRTAPVITSPASSAVPNSNARPTIRGTGVAGATLTVKDGDDVLGTTTVLPNGTWVLPLTQDLIDGRHEFVATQAGTNGAASAESNHVIYVVDTVALAPKITNPPGLVRTPQNRRVIAGTSEAGAAVIVRKQSSIWCATRATAAGTWSCPAANVQPNGFALLTAVQTDVAGNVSPEADTRLVVVDTLPAGAPRITSPSPNSRGTAGTVWVTGTGAAGGQVTLLVDGREVGKVFMSLNGLWSIPTPKLAAGSHTFSAYQVDGTGNRSTMSSRVIAGFGASTSGGYVVEINRGIDKASYATATVRLAGIGFPGSKVVVRDERGVQATTTVARAAAGSRTGAWALVFPSSPDGIHRYTATQTTVVTGGGRMRTVTATSAPIQLRIDRVAPPAPALVSPLSTEIQATRLPSFGGSAEPGVVVVATIDGRLIEPANPRLQGAITDNDRRWVVRSSVSVAAGTHTLRLYAVDPAGNRSATTTATLRTKTASAG